MTRWPRSVPGRWTPVPYPYVWVDALTVKCHEEGRIAGVAAVVATGVGASGYREILGVDVVTSEDGAGSMGFLRDLVARGVAGVQLVICDAHHGLVEAVAAVLPSSSWQRCRMPFLRNPAVPVPRSAQGLVAMLVRTVLAQPDATSTPRPAHPDRRAAQRTVSGRCRAADQPSR